LTRKVLMIVGLAALTELLACSGSATAANWLPAGGKTCDEICKNPVVSGTLSHPDARYNGNSYFVCRADVGGGKRAGYNLRPDWARACFVAFGGKETRGRSYDCLCE
jgi:hypothetical protein